MFWAWIIAVIVVAFGARLSGGDARMVAGATALALAPGVAGFILLPWLEQRGPALALVSIWFVAAVGLVSGAGGAMSPLAVLFALVPTQAAALRLPWIGYAGAAAVLGYALASVLALGASSPVVLLGAFPELLAVVSIAFAALLTGWSLRAPGAAAPRRIDATQQRIAETAHELRTPLTHILGFAEMIEQQIFGPIADRYVEYAGLIRRSGSHLLEIVNDHLDASRIDAGRYELQLERFDVHALVQDIVEQAADSALAKSINLGVWRKEGALLVEADQRALRRMVLNILGNALKFTPEGGRVILAARGDGDVLVLEAIDNGPGIPGAERRRLGRDFERGASGEGVEGTGLGLAMVRALAELHGGTLSFHDAPGGGALVRIEMPVIAAPD
ncbi:MAG: sensor histidine kinase [Hyphomonadaceae bacterium]